MVFSFLSIALAFAPTATVTFAGPAGEDDDTAMAPEREMVRDPSTGEMISAPQYGGQLVFSWEIQQAHLDTWWGSAHMERGAVLEKLGMVDWAISRDK